MSFLNLKIKGLKQIRKRLKTADDTYRGALATAIYQKGQSIMTDSKKECPVYKGFLRGSGYVNPNAGSPTRPATEIGYGKEYGPYVHEIRGLNHPVGKDHFLSDPLDAHKSGYTRWIQKKTRENLSSGTTKAGRISSSHPKNPKGGK